MKTFFKPRFLVFLVFSLSFSLNKIAAVVGEEIILKSDIEEMVSMQASQGVFLSEEKVLETLIQQKVLVYFARKDSSLVVDETQLNQMVKEQLDSYKTQFGGSIEALEKYFDKSFSQIFDFLYKQGEDIFLANQLKQQLFYKTSISSAEVRSFYSLKKDSLELTPPLYSYSCFQKKIVPSQKRLLKTQSIADSLLFEIKNNGATFSSFFSSFSGGEVEFKRGDFGLPEFEWAAFSLKNKGDLVGPVLTSLGYHLIQLEERLGERVKVNHLLFPISLEKEDEEIVFSEINKVLSFGDIKKIDSLLKQEKKDEEGFSGVFKKAPDYLIPKKVLASLQNIGVKSFSEIIKTEDSFFFVYLSSFQPPSPPSLQDHWEQIEWIAHQDKFSLFFEDWYLKNKNKVYIKKY